MVSSWFFAIVSRISPAVNAITERMPSAAPRIAIAFNVAYSNPEEERAKRP